MNRSYREDGLCQCPLGLLPHFYDDQHLVTPPYQKCQCPLGLLPHFYKKNQLSKSKRAISCVNALSGCYLISTHVSTVISSISRSVSMPSRAVTSFLHHRCAQGSQRSSSVNALSGCYLISTEQLEHFSSIEFEGVNALSGCYLISTKFKDSTVTIKDIVSMPSRAVTSFLQVKDIKSINNVELRVNALSGCYLISTVPLQKPRFYAVSRACFCRYLSEYSDSNLFSCMLTIWTYLMR